MNQRKSNMTEITSEQFITAFGAEPVQDDLERCNCDKAGEKGHFYCGWNHQKNGPVFMHGPEQSLSQ